MMLEVKNVYKSYKKTGSGIRKEKINVLNGVRLILGLEKADQGSVLIEGKEVSEWIKSNRGQMSVVFQDYSSSANPRYKVRDCIGELLQAFGENDGINDKVDYLLGKVGLPLSLADRYPHEEYALLGQSAESQDY